MPRNARFCTASQSSTTTPALTTAYAIRPVYIDNDGVATSRVMLVGAQGIGMTRAQTFMATVTCANPQTLTGITFKIQVSYDGANATTAAATNWNDVEITNLADNTTAIEHTLSCGAGLTATANYGTTNATNAPYCRTLVKATGGNAVAGESATVYVVAS